MVYDIIKIKHKKINWGAPKKRKRRKVHPTERIQHKVKAKVPNHIWTVDFKGWWYTPHHVANAKAQFGLTKLAAWWLSLGIRLDRIDPGKPYQNGAHERMHLDMKNELEGQINGDLKLHQSIFEVWRKEFNTERPHQAIEMKKPAQIYVKSTRKYRPVDDLVYPPRILSRQVNDRGCTFYKGNKIFLSNAFNGFNVGLDVRPKERIKIWFANNLLGEVDRKDFIFTPNKKMQTVTN
ncbi:MAG: transposase [Flavobacteriaceae bacterium]|nr:transposase [Flavobacteriaceae bacterium]